MRAAPATASLESVFSPVRSQTAFEETVERLGTAIKLGLLVPGARLPPERDLCARLGIARSTLRQALTARREDCARHGAGFSWERSCDQFLAALAVDCPAGALAA